MEVESFESEEIAKLMNDWFVNIKVSSTFVDLCNFIYILRDYACPSMVNGS